MWHHSGAGNAPVRGRITASQPPSSRIDFRVKQHWRHIFNISLKGFYLRGASTANVRLDSP